jgi:predicted esterase
MMRAERLAVLAGAVVASIVASMVTGAASWAQSVLTTDSRLPVGTVVPRVTSRADSTEHYAVYLPTRYDTTGRWPALLLLDPRGRAMIAMRRFQEAAERDGYIVISSYNTVSDSTEEPNVHALNAMLLDLQNDFATDTRRMYLAGFSGTARLAWAYAYELAGHVPGVLGFAAGLPWRGIDAYTQLKRPASFVYFGGAGTSDFNFDEVRALEETLDSVTTIPHRLEYFDGPHGWPPSAICGDAVDWMEVQAMTQGLRPRNDSLVTAWVTQRLALALAAEDSGDSYQAYVRYRAVRDDFHTLHDVTFATTRIAALERLPALRDRRKRDRELQTAFEDYSKDRFRPFITALHEKRPPALGSALHDLNIAALQRQARDSTHDPLGAQAARRMLALVSVNTAFYLPRQYFVAHDPARALAALAIAHEIQPASPFVCLGQAKAYALLGQVANAIGSLQCAKAGGTLTAADLRAEPDFDRIRGDAAFTSFAAALPAASPPESDDD